MSGLDNHIPSVKRLLTLLNIPYTKGYIEDAVLSHPDYPSLLALSDTLEKYGVGTLAIKINENKLGSLPLPCTVQVLLNNSPFFYTLVRVDKETVTCYDDKDKRITQSKDDFIDIWTGVCLLVEKSEESKEEGIEDKLKAKKVRNSLLILFLGFIVLLVVLGLSSGKDNSSLPFYAYSVYFLLKCFGLAASVMLLWFEIDKYNPTIQSFCANTKKVSCDLVLNSEYSKILSGKLSLSSIGFSYFFGSIIYLLTTSFSSSSMAFLGYLSLMTIPVVIISAYIQAMVLKKWCKFCVVIQGVLILEIITILVAKFYSLPVSLESIPIFMVFFIAPILGWLFLKPLLEKERKANIYKRGLKKIKHDPNVLNSFLTKSRKISEAVGELGILFKNDGAKYDVIKVCNPYCGPCSKAHPILESLVKNGKINLRIIFTAGGDINGPSLKPVKHFLAIDAQGNKSLTKKALDQWYGNDNKDYESFAENYPMNGELYHQDPKIEAMRDWCENTGITHTPTIFINGFELPDEYSVEDLKGALN